MVRLVRRHPDHFARVDKIGHITVGSVGNHSPHPSKGPVMVRSTGGARHSSGEKRLAISADGGDKGAVDEHLEQSPSLSRRRSVAPGRWPAQAVGQEVAMVRDRSDAEASTPDGSPLPINERAITVPRDILRASDVVGEGDNPGKGTSRFPRRDSNLDSKQAMQLEVPKPVVGDLVPHETGSGRRGRPPFGGEGARAGEPVVEGADRLEAQLASIVVSAEGRNRRFPGLRPLSSTDSGGEVTSALVGPAGPDVASASAAPIALDERADGAGARDKNGPVSTRGVGADIGMGRNQPRQKLVSLSPSMASDSMLDFFGNHDRGVDLEVDKPALVSDEHGSTAVRPTDPAEGGDERGGGASGNGPPRSLGVGKLVLRLREGALEVLKGEPLIPDSESPVPND